MQIGKGYISLLEIKEQGRRWEDGTYGKKIEQRKNKNLEKSIGLWVFSLLMNLHFIQQEKCIVLYSYTNLKKFAVKRVFNII